MFYCWCQYQQFLYQNKKNCYIALHDVLLLIPVPFVADSYGSCSSSKWVKELGNTCQLSGYDDSICRQPYHWAAIRKKKLKGLQAEQEVHKPLTLIKQGVHGNKGCSYPEPERDCSTALLCWNFQHLVNGLFFRIFGL